MPRIAVLLTAYNGMLYIEEQIRSILCQQDVDVTLFISIDRSTDGTEKWCEQLASENTNVICLEYGQKFGSAGPNFYRLLRDVEFTNFEFIALADQDDIWNLWKLSRACKILNDETYDVYSSDVEAFWPNGRVKLIKKSYPQRKFDYFFEAAGPGCTYMLRKDAAEVLQRFLRSHEDVFQLPEPHDWIIYAFMRTSGFRWYIDPIMSVRYRQHGANQVGTNVGFFATLKRLKLIKNKWYRNQVESIVQVVDPKNLKNVASWVFLMKNSLKLRRHPRDRILLLLMIFFGVY